MTSNLCSNPFKCHRFKDSDICWLYGPIFYANPVAERRQGGTSTSTTGFMQSASSVDIVHRQTTPGANDPARPLTKSDSLEKLNLIDGGHHHPPLKSALKKRDPEDIVSVIRRERELLHSMAEQDFKMGKRSASPGRHRATLPRSSGAMARSKSTSDLATMRFGAVAVGKAGKPQVGTPMIESTEPKWPTSPGSQTAAPKPVSSRANLADMLAEAASQIEQRLASPADQSGGHSPNMPAAAPTDSDVSGDESYQPSDKLLRFNRKVEQRIIFDLYNEEDANGSDEEYEQGGSGRPVRMRRASVLPNRAGIAAAGTVELKVDSYEPGTGPMIVDTDMEDVREPNLPTDFEDDEDEDDESESEDEGMMFGARKVTPAAPSSAQIGSAAQPKREGSPGGLIDSARHALDNIKKNLGL